MGGIVFRYTALSLEKLIAKESSSLALGAAREVFGGAKIVWVKAFVPAVQKGLDPFKE